MNKNFFTLSFSKKIRFLAAPFCKIAFYFLDYLTPKDDHLVVFAQRKCQYSDNGKALYDCINSTHGAPWKATWLYMGPFQNNYPKTSVYRFSLKGLWMCLRARFFVHSHGRVDFNPYSHSPRTKLINLWHGIAIKDLYFYDKKHAKTSPRKLAHECSSDLQCVSSKEDMYHMSATFQMPPSKLAITGLPRTDKLFIKSSDTSAIDLPAKVLQGKTVLYAPTHRDYNDIFVDFFPFDDVEIETIHQFLIDQDAYMIFREHRHDKGSLKKLDEYCARSDSRFYQLHPDMLHDVMELLPFVDVIITDYSSIYLDLLLTNTPCIFMPYDLEDYLKRRGLAYNYDDVTPGPKVSTQKEFLEELNEALQGAPKYQQQRDKVKRLFHQYTSGGSCKRVLEEMEKFI